LLRIYEFQQPHRFELLSRLQKVENAFAVGIPATNRQVFFWWCCRNSETHLQAERFNMFPNTEPLDELDSPLRFRDDDFGEEAFDEDDLDDFEDDDDFDDDFEDDDDFDDFEDDDEFDDFEDDEDFDDDEDLDDFEDEEDEGEDGDYYH